MQSHACDAAPADPESARASKMPRIDTVQAMLNRTPANIPKPPKTFLCPLCQISIGRKGLAGHLRNAHQVDKPEFFCFRPSRDMMPGRLGCAHCMSCFTTEAALKLHYQRATCPALLIEWVQNLHFDPVAVMESTTLTIAQPEEHLLEPHRPEFIGTEPDLVPPADSIPTWPCPCGLQIPDDTPTWHSALSHDLCAGLIDRQPSFVMQITPTFGPKHRLS